ncbi:tail tape measure protein [Providencia phage PSTCR6]|nr:tail tape measure protein [Providencia phage PSTCR6]
MKSPTTFRNKNVIEQKTLDAKNTRPLQAANEHLDKINDNLNDMTGQSNNISDAITSAGNKVETAVQDVQAGVELVIDSLEPLRDISSALELSIDLQAEMNENISKLSSMLQDKFAEKVNAPVIVEAEISETEESFTKNLPIPVQDDPLKEAISKLFPASPDEPENILDKPKEKDDDKNPNDLLDKINKGITSGFKASYEMTNRIASMLFNYTVAAALTAAKWAAILLAIVMGLDLVIIHLRHWGKLFNESYELFEEKLGPIAPILGKMFSTINDIKEFWKSGDWGGLAVAVIKGVGGVIYNIAEAIEYGLGKLGATILRALGKNDLADSLEAMVVENYAIRTGYMPTPEELELISKRRYEQERGKIEYGDSVERVAIRARMNSLGETPEEAAAHLKENNPSGLFSGPLYDEKKLDEEAKTVNLVSKDDVAKATEVEFKINQLKRQAQEHKNDPKVLEEISDKLQELSLGIINDDSIDTDSKLYDMAELAQEAATETYQMFESVKPQPPEEKEDSKSLNTISKDINIPTASNISTQNNQQINNINTNRTITNFAPVTNYDAPGMYRAQEVS